MSKIFLRLTFIIWMLIPVLSIGQETKSKIISKSKVSQESASDFIDRAEQIVAKDPKSALDLIDRAINLNVTENNKRVEARSYDLLGRINYSQKLYAQSASFYQKSLMAYTILNDANNIYRVRYRLAQAYELNGYSDKALSYYRLCLDYIEKSNRENEIVTLSKKIAELNERLNKVRGYDSNSKKEDLDANQKSTSPGVSRSDKKNKKSIIEEEELATEDASPVPTSSGVPGHLKLAKREKLDRELSVRMNSINTSKAAKDTVKLSDDYNTIGQIYLQKQEPNKALPFLEKGKALSAPSVPSETKIEIYQALSEAYKQKGDYAKAFESYKLYAAEKDSMLSRKEKNLSYLANFNEELSQRQKKIDLLEKDRKLSEQMIQLLKDEKKFTRYIIYSLIIGLVIVFVSSWLIYNSSRKRRIANQVLALKSLRSQMNPHFIFNALNSVNNYISKNDERAANKYLSDFSKLMRTVMENSQHEFISLATELSILELYLSLEHSRFKDKFEYEMNVSENLFTEEIEIPPMLVQPYIENAIWHGLRYLDEKGFLKVSITAVDNVLKIVIEDNGIGRKKSQELKTANQRDKVSTGLKNTENRLKIINELYGTRMKVQLEDLYPETQSGTRATIYITQARKHVS